jgi:hypothetical protein
MVNYSWLGHLTLCCLQKNILPNGLVTSTLQCILLHREMSGCGGMISDILMVCGFLISLSFSSIEMILQRTIFCLVVGLFNVTALVTDVYGYMYIYKYEYKCL